MEKRDTFVKLDSSITSNEASILHICQLELKGIIYNHNNYDHMFNSLDSFKQIYIKVNRTFKRGFPEFLRDSYKSLLKVMQHVILKKRDTKPEFYKHVNFNKEPYENYVEFPF